MKMIVAVIIIWASNVNAQTPLITNIDSRETLSLDGRWQYIIDPYGTGYYDYRMKEKNETDRDAYWQNDTPQNKSDRVEFGYSNRQVLQVPGDWNSQAAKFLYYEGIVWYKKTFDFVKTTAGKKVFIWFGAVNYQCDVYLNGKKLGYHKGGFTPFNFEIPVNLLRAKGNFVVVKADNTRHADEIPTVNTDWWNYGGITRDVELVIVPQHFITDYSIRLSDFQPSSPVQKIQGWIKFNLPVHDSAIIDIAELHFRKIVSVEGDSAAFSCALPGVQLWSDIHPKLYAVHISGGGDRIADRIGFRTIEVQGEKIVLNGQPVFLRGICIHEEITPPGRRAYSRNDALHLLLEVKQLHGNMARLAHYPHNENMVRLADSLGILIWSEIPVYWTIDFSSAEVLQKAKQQLHEMISRDHNRASVIIWSVGNETPVNETRTKFMSELVTTARLMDNSRLISAALQSHTDQGVIIVDDPLGAYTDIVAVNEYLGWYGGLPSACRLAKWNITFAKPLFFSETGAGAQGGFHADSMTIWSEEYQQWYYREQISMMRRMPENFSGMSPWILNDFRSPRRNNPVYQQGWNIKGLFDRNGHKKKAFYVLRDYYEQMAKKEN